MKTVTSRREFLSSAAGALGAAAVAVSAPFGNSAQAEPQIAHSPPETHEKREAWMNASDYSKTHREVAIAVYGRTEKNTGKEVADFIEARLKERGMPSKTYFAQEDRVGIKVGFYLKGLQYGPTDLSGVKENIETLVVHFPQAWPPVVGSTAPDLAQR